MSQEKSSGTGGGTPEKQETLPIAESIKAGARFIESEVPEFMVTLNMLSDEEIVELDHRLLSVGMGAQYTLSAFPGEYTKFKGDYKVDWSTFQKLVEDWKNTTPEPNSNPDIRQLSLANKRDPIERKLVDLFDDALYAP